MPQLIVPSLAIPGASLFSDGLLPPMLGQQRSVQKMNHTPSVYGALFQQAGKICDITAVATILPKEEGSSTFFLILTLVTRISGSQ